jgi:hypothetical protein
MTTVRSAALGAARVTLLAGPTALAFFSGGYFDEARAWAGLGAWLLVLLGALAGGRPVPRDRGARLALGGLALLAAWTLLSMLWAPIVGSAYHAGQIVVLYLGVLWAATILLDGRRVLAAVEPAAALGALIMIGYGLSERLLPGVLAFARSATAQGRLEQPLTYWNAMGEAAAIGLVLSARLAGDASRPRWLRTVASASAAPLGMGLYASFSRGALFAFAAGLVALLVAAPVRMQLRALLVTVGTAILAAVVAAPLEGVTSLGGSLSTREGQGAIALAALAVIAIAASAGQLWFVAAAPSGSLQLPRRASLWTLGVVCAGLALAIVIGAHERAGVPISGSATRLATLQSNRYDYWRVALRAFAAEPLHGVGAGGWAVWWLRDRPYAAGAQDAHSLELQTLAELGIVGIVLLAAFLAGIALAARRAYGAAPGAAAGLIAGFVVWLAHSPLDWDWQMPAVTLITLVLGGGLLALADRSAAAPELTRDSEPEVARAPQRSAAPHG